MNSLPVASSSARRTSNRAVSSATSSCAFCTAASAFIFDDFLLGLGDFGLRLLERELLIGRIELDHHVVLLDRHAGRISLTMRSAPGPTGGVTSVIVRPARSSPVAWTVRFNGSLLTRAVGTAEPRSGRRGHGDGDGGARADDRNHDGNEQHTALQSVLLINSAPGGRRCAMRSPGATPEATIACSRPRR